MKTLKKAVRKAAARKKAEDKKAAQIKGGEDSRADEDYVKEKVREHLEKKERREPLLFGPSPEEGSHISPDIIMIREKEDNNLEQCLVRNNQPPDLFSSYYGRNSLIYRVLEMKIFGLSYRKIDEKMKDEPGRSKVRKVLAADAGIELVLANQPASQPRAIIYVPRSPSYAHPRPPIALVSRDALQQGRHQAGLKLDEDWRKDAIKKGEKDDERKRKIETAAVNAVAQYYLQNGYDHPKSVELKNYGWDLECRAGKKEFLRVEVKGTEEADWSKIQVELTPNEIRQAGNYRKSYRLAIVRNALQDPKCAIYRRDGDGWQRANIPDGDFEGDLDGNDMESPPKLMTEPLGSVIVRRRD